MQFPADFLMEVIYGDAFLQVCRRLASKKLCSGPVISRE
jgi:hypothetical protein